MAVTSPDRVRATKKSSGSRLPISCSEPSSKLDALAEHQEPAAAQVELADRLDVGGGAADAQVAAELDVEAAAAHEDAVRGGDAHVEREAGAAGGGRRRGSPTRARSRVTCTPGGVRTWRHLRERRRR